MLEKITIHKLFGRYDYDIDLAIGSSCEGLLFVTGPNGMGKTTIFKMINSLYKAYFEYFLSVPYLRVTFSFGGGYAIEFRQRVENGETDEKSDVLAEQRVSVSCSFVRSDGQKYEYCWMSSEDIAEQKKNGAMSALLQFLLSDACFYISDDRLNPNGKAIFDDSTVEPSVLGKLLSTILQSITDNFLVADVVSTEENIESRTTAVRKSVSLLKRFGLYLTEWEQKLNTLKGEELSMMVCRCENALQSCEKETSLVEEFLKMMEKASFVDKELVLSPKYGYRFRMTDTQMFIEFDKLSSGERQYFCLMYNLFFMVHENLLVLIDEPEISFHLMWQMSFCRQMKALVKLKNLYMLIATHSTEMFDGDFALTTDLYKQQKK